MFNFFYKKNYHMSCHWCDTCKNDNGSGQT